MTCWFAPLILRLGANQHLAHPGDIVFRHACAMGLEGIVSKRLDPPASSPIFSGSRPNAGTCGFPPTTFFRPFVTLPGATSAQLR